MKQSLQLLQRIVDEYRNRHGLSQKEFACWLDIHHVYFNAVLRGRVPVTSKMIARLRTCIGLPDELIIDLLVS